MPDIDTADRARERPILFSAPMVRAILSGAKTQTRRAWKIQPPPGARVGWIPGRSVSRYGKPGDRLWVRETFRDREIGEAGHDTVGGLVYRATENVDGLAERWRPSIHMSRQSSRITLEITGVRVERLQAISAEDAMAEGVVEFRPYLKGLEPCLEWRYAFEDLWCSINGRDSWTSNPWVWAISFARVRP